jgi:hypothetical protein
MKGGFYPSVMHGVATTGPMFITACVAQGVRLLRNNTERLRERARILGQGSKSRSKSRRGTTRHSKRSKRKATARLRRTFA